MADDPGIPITDEQKTWWSRGFKAGMVAKTKQVLDALLPPPGPERDAAVARAMATAQLQSVVAEPAAEVEDE